MRHRWNEWSFAHWYDSFRICVVGMVYMVILYGGKWQVNIELEVRGTTDKVFVWWALVAAVVAYAVWVARRISNIEKRIEIIKTRVNDGQKIGLFE